MTRTILGITMTNQEYNDIINHIMIKYGGHKWNNKNPEEAKKIILFKNL